MRIVVEKEKLEKKRCREDELCRLLLVRRECLVRLGETVGKGRGKEGKRGKSWCLVGSFHDSVELQPRCLGGGEGKWQILDHVVQALQVLWLTSRPSALSGDESPEISISNYYSLHGMLASHTTPNPSTGLASGGVPTEAS